MKMTMCVVDAHDLHDAHDTRHTRTHGEDSAGGGGGEGQRTDVGEDLAAADIEGGDALGHWQGLGHAGALDDEVLVGPLPCQLLDLVEEVLLQRTT
jgi:hypothetical protein